MPTSIGKKNEKSLVLILLQAVVSNIHPHCYNDLINVSNLKNYYTRQYFFLPDFFNNIFFDY